MKTIKLILTAILLMVAYVANAQTIQVYKDDAVVKEYSSAEVDSVVYKPAAAQPRYYYYAGWTKPNSEAELANLVAESDGKTSNAKYIGASLGTYSKSNPLMSPDLIMENDDFAYYYVVVPNGIGIYDSEGDATLLDFFTEQTSIRIPNHTVYKSNRDDYYVSGLMIR